MLTKGVTVNSLQKSKSSYDNAEPTAFFTPDGSLCYCHDINRTSTFSSLSQEHVPAEWRLFIDSSQRSLKAVLLHIGNAKPSMPIAHSVYLKESYDNMKTLFELVTYKNP